MDVKRKVIYCEIGFLEILFERLSREYSPLNDDWEEGEYARKIIKNVFSQGCINIHFDDIHKFQRLLTENEYFCKMVKRAESTEGYAEMDCDSYSPMDEITENELNAMYFVVSGEDKANQKGVLALSPTTINDKTLYGDFGIVIKKNEPLTWKEILKNIRYNCNALMIFDNYLYKEKDYNLYSILNTLLPQELPNKISFQISLFMQEEKGTKIENEYNKIERKLKELRPNLNFEFAIYQCFTSDFHDRCILTNHVLVSSEGGFDLLKKHGSRTESSKVTTIHMKYPFLQGSTSSALNEYAEFINKAKSIVRSHKSIPEGSNANRLL